MLTKGRIAKNTAIRMTGKSPSAKFTKPTDNAFKTERKIFFETCMIKFLHSFFIYLLT